MTWINPNDKTKTDFPEAQLSCGHEGPYQVKFLAGSVNAQLFLRGLTGMKHVGSSAR